MRTRNREESVTESDFRSVSTTRTVHQYMPISIRAPGRKEKGKKNHYPTPWGYQPKKKNETK